MEWEIINLILREQLIERLRELAMAEVEALRGDLERPEDVRMHSCGVVIGPEGTSEQTAGLLKG